MYRSRPKVKSRVRSDRLDDRGREIPTGEDLIAQMQFRPPTLEQQIARLEYAGELRRMFFEGVDPQDDNFGEDLDDLPDEGITPYEEPFLKAPKKPVQKGKEKSPPSPTPAKEESPEGDSLGQ